MGTLLDTEIAYTANHDSCVQQTFVLKDIGKSLVEFLYMRVLAAELFSRRPNLGAIYPNQKRLRFLYIAFRRPTVCHQNQLTYNLLLPPLGPFMESDTRGLHPSP